MRGAVVGFSAYAPSNKLAIYITFGSSSKGIASALSRVFARVNDCIFVLEGVDTSLVPRPGDEASIDTCMRWKQNDSFALLRGHQEQHGTVTSRMLPKSRGPLSEVPETRS